MALAIAVMFLTALAFWLLPRPIVGLYLDLTAPENQPVIAMAVALLGVAAVFQIFDGLQVAAAGALRGLKDTRVPMMIGVLSYWICGLGTGYVLGFSLDLGPLGLWWGLVIGLFVAGMLLTARFHFLLRRRGLAAGGGGAPIAGPADQEARSGLAGSSAPPPSRPRHGASK
jgi:MATE family multidrug resistance protein